MRDNLKYLLLSIFVSVAVQAQTQAIDPAKEQPPEVTQAERQEQTNPKAVRAKQEAMAKRVAAILAGREGLPENEKLDPSDKKTGSK